MQTSYPLLANTPNLNERQIVYTSSPQNLEFQLNFNYASEYILENSESEETTSEQSSSDKEDFAVQVRSNKHMALRASTAPARPLTDIEEFRRSSNFLMIEHTVVCGLKLVLREDNKIDLDSEEGQIQCKKFLNQLERLCEVFQVETICRDYRRGFSKAYRVLYEEGSLCYLTEILDSAQEGFPYLYVNAEKYLFSEEVLEAGKLLSQGFKKIQKKIREIYNKAFEETCHGFVSSLIEELSVTLREFDTLWVRFEHMYVHELMVIEEDARQLIKTAIDIEKELIYSEIKEKSRGRIACHSQDFIEKRRKLVKVVCKINSVANLEGKGRDDLKVEILEEAESLSRKIRSIQRKPIRLLADRIRQSFSELRKLLRKYGQNIEIVDPQLKNNPDLVEALVKFESTWEKGKSYLLSPKKFKQLVYFSELIEEMSLKYKSFKDQVECSDSELFLSIPALLVLKCLEDEDRGLCKYFLPTMFHEDYSAGMIWKRLKRSYKLGKLAASSEYEYKELFEKAVIGETIDNVYRSQILNRKFDNLDYSLNKIRNLATELHRYKPTDWNRFLDVSLYTDS